MFGTYITPENPDYYSKLELQGFVQKFVLGPDTVLTDDLMDQVMKVKQVVLGGDNDKITRDELARAQQLIATLQAQTTNLLPHLRVLFMVEDPSGGVSPDEVTAAQAAMSQLVESLGTFLNPAPIAYDVASAQALLTDIDELYTHVDGWEGPKKIVNYLNSFAAFKIFLSKAPGNAVAGPEWVGLFHQLSDAYAIWLRYHYAIDHAHLMTSQTNLAQWSLISVQLHDLMNTAVTQKPNAVIDYATIGAMIHEIYRLDFFTLPLTEITLTGALRPALGTILNPVKNGIRPPVTGLDTAMLDYILQNLNGLFEVQSLYLQALDRVGSASKVTYESLREIWPTLDHNYAEAWSGMLAIINAKFPLYLSDDKTLIFNDDVVSQELSGDNFFALNWQRGAIALVADGYSANPAATQLSGLTGAQFQAIYNDLHPVAEELGLFKPGDTQTWKNLAQYAEMFMPSSDGGTGVTFNEGIETLNTILSASVVGRHIFSDMSDQCTTVSTNSTPAIPISCFRLFFRKDMDEQFTNFPEMVRSIDALSDADYATFLDNLQLVMRQHGAAPTAPFTLAEVTNAANFLHYVESIMWRFDTNHDGQLTLAESMVAYPIFKQILMKASGFKNDSDLRAVYTYLLKYQESPKASLWNTAKFVLWKLNPGSWTYDDNRADLVAVMARISEATNSATAGH